MAGYSPKAASLESDRVAPNDAVFFYGLAGLLIFAPLIWGSIVPLPLLVIELAALALLAGWFWQPVKPSLSWPMRIFLALLILLPLAQLLPVPTELWASLPGRAFYANALQQAGVVGPGHEWRAIALIPATTESAWLTLLPPLAVFVTALTLPSRTLLKLVWVFLGIAAGQALLGLIQYGDGTDSPFRFGVALSGPSATGTYVNRNHLAGLLEMALPLALGLLAVAVGQGPRRHVSRRQHGWRRGLAFLSAARFNQALLFGAVALAILLGLIFTRSRAGVMLAMLGILLCTLLFSSRLGGRNVYGLLGTFTAAGIGLASLIGLAPVLDRFTLQDPMADGRWLIVDATVQAMGQFFPLGSGAGSFEAVMRRFHPPELPGVILNYAHNDYLEWLLEAGLGAALLIAAGLVFYLRQWGRVWRRGEWTPFRFAQVGAGIALLLMLLHTLVDFNLRIPANAVLTAFLAAVFFHRAAEEEPAPSRRRKSSGDDEGTEKPLPPLRTIPPENQINPFA
jgi:O-antigen ligase